MRIRAGLDAAADELELELDVEVELASSLDD